MSATTMRSGNSGGQQQPAKGNILSRPAYSIFSRSSNDYARHGPAAGPAAGSGAGGSGSRRLTTTSSSYLQRSTSADNVQIVRQRGFKPSDRHDPAKRHFLESLTSKILHFDMDSGSSSPINLQKLLTPASDSNETLHLRNKKMYASSCFYAASHPTVEDQVELARRISSSLSDVKNVKSKGQSMYVNRKKRSVKWIHDGNGQEDEEEESAPAKSQDKLPLRCMMNPGGKLLDYRCYQALGEQPSIPQVPPHPERLYDIVRDLNNQKGRGAEIFAKRRKRSEKWVVDSELPQSPSICGYANCPAKQDSLGGGGGAANDHSNLDSQAFYSPFALSMDYSSPVLPSCGHQCSHASFSSAHSDCGPCAYGPYPTLYPPPYGPAYGPYPPCAAPLRKNKLYPGEPSDKLFRRSSAGRAAMAPARSPKALRNGFSYLSGMELHKSPAGQRSGRGPVGCGYQNGAAALCQLQRASGCPNNCQPPEPAADDGERPPEDYTPVPVKQLIQEFEKTCRPLMQFKHCAAGPPAMLSPGNGHANGHANGHGDLSRYFDSRRQACYRRAAEADQQRAGNGYAHSSAGDDEQDDDDDDDDEEEGAGDFDDDDDDDASLDDSLSPVDFYRAEPPQPNGHANNRSSSAGASDDYYRRQSQQQARAKFAETELAAAVSHRKALKKTPVLENLVAGTTTPECFKETFTQDIATKLTDNLYHGPKISSYQNLTNYNTAPRGWDQSQSVYRPIRFQKPQDTKISYSDF